MMEKGWVEKMWVQRVNERPQTVKEMVKKMVLKVEDQTAGSVQKVGERIQRTEQRAQNVMGETEMEQKVEMVRVAGTVSKVGEMMSKTVEAERKGARVA